MITLLIIIIALLLIVIITMAVFLLRKPKPTIEQLEKKLQEEREEKYIQAVLNYNIDTARGSHG